MARTEPKGAKPSRATQEAQEWRKQAATICAGLAEGKSLRTVCQQDGMPSPSTVLRWLEAEDKPGFSEQYARARAVGYQLLADDILDISDDSAGDVITDEDGVQRTDAERVTRSRLRVDSRKWLLSKMLPKVYGEKVTQEVTGANGGPLLVANAAELTDDQLAAIAAGHAQR